MRDTTPQDRDLLGAGSYKADNRLGSKSVLGTVEKSGAGNIVLHVGRLNTPEPGWQQTEHLVLEPDEARVLVAQLLTLLGEPSAVQLLDVAVKRAANFLGASDLSRMRGLPGVSRERAVVMNERGQGAEIVVRDMLMALRGLSFDKAETEARSLIRVAAALLPEYR